jgi:hypothetical protein
MRAPSSFRMQLTELQKQLQTTSKAQGALGLIERWRNHGAAETIWATVSDKIPGWTARDFIFTVLADRLNAERLNVLLDWDKNITGNAEAQIKAHLRAGEMADVTLKSAALVVYQESRRHVSRKRKTAARTYFMRLSSGRFVEMCGQPLDEVVAAITEIAFGEETGSEAVRRARRPQ